MSTRTTRFLLLIAFTSGFGSSCGETDSDDPSVVTDCGTLKGKTVHTTKGQCHAYLGAPFAAPPVGDLRWKKPQPPQCWSVVRNATELGPGCVQLGSTSQNPPELESEDCLYLNVLVPSSTGKPNSKLPVMVFIHGGSFVEGTTMEYGVEGPCDNLATRGVIVVLIQYRLNLYGLFSTGDEAARGNFAIWDQIEALTWVKKNIDRFGGDSERVTIFGESAGGASVSYLTYTPLAKDLFHQSISQSGSARAFWASPHEASVSSAEKILRATNCTVDGDSEAAVRCLRRLSTAEIQSVVNAILNVSSMEFYHFWSIRIDGELLTESEFRELDDGKAVVIGVNSMEEPAPLVANIPMAVELFEQALNSVFAGNHTARNEAIKEVARYVYLDSKGDPSDLTFVAQQLGKFQAHRMFHQPAALEASAKAAVGKPVWVYNFDYWAEGVFPGDYPFEKGAEHVHELCYLFLMNPIPEVQEVFHCPIRYRGTNGLVADYLGEMWTNFAKDEDPSPEGLRWPRFSNVSRASSMTVRSDLSIEPHFYLDVASFWNSLVPQLNRIDFE